MTRVSDRNSLCYTSVNPTLLVTRGPRWLYRHISITGRRRKRASWLTHLSVSWWPRVGPCFKKRKCKGRVEGAGGLHWLKRMNKITVLDRCFDWCWYTCKSCLSTCDQYCQRFLWCLVFLFVLERFYCSLFVFSFSVQSTSAPAQEESVAFLMCDFICLLKHFIAATLFVSAQVCLPMSISNVVVLCRFIHAVYAADGAALCVYTMLLYNASVTHSTQTNVYAFVSVCLWVGGNQINKLGINYRTCAL